MSKNKTSPKTISEYHAKPAPKKETFADKVRYAIANYAELQKTIREFKQLKYIAKNSYPTKRLRYNSRGLLFDLVLEQRTSPENWVIVHTLQRHGRNTIGDWIK